MNKKTTLVLLAGLFVLTQGCGNLCNPKGNVTTGGGASTAIAKRLLAACDSTRYNAVVTGVHAPTGVVKEVSTTAVLENMAGDTIRWTTAGDAAAAGPLTGAVGKATLKEIPSDTLPQQYEFTMDIPDTPTAGKTLTIKGVITVRTNPSPTTCDGEGTWNIPGVGNGSWKFGTKP